MTSIWDRYPDLSGGELRNLVAAAAQVLADAADAADAAQLPADPLELSTRQAARELAPSAEELDDVQELLEDDETATQLSIAVLDQVRSHPELAEAVAAAYAERSRKMSGAELLLLAGALVVIAVRIKEIKTGKDGTRITFSESGEAIKAFLAGLISSIRG